MRSCLRCANIAIDNVAIDSVAIDSVAIDSVAGDNVAVDDDLFLFHPEAVVEVLNAHDRYAKVTYKLAERFQDELERSREAIARGPFLWPEYLEGTRRYLMKGFPYFIVYRPTSSRIDIIALVHERRRPGYWIERAKP